MREQLARLVREAATSALGRNVAREYLQARILDALQRTGAMVPLAFQGGTALRFLYDLPRHSEDLDFAMERPGEGFSLKDLLQRVQGLLVREGYEPAIKLKDHGAVRSAFLQFPGLPQWLGLSPHANEILSVKVEVDTQPPAGAGLETTVVRRHALLHLQHHDRASLFAGKLHAVLHRPHVKGRDLFDLLWYLSDRSWPAPNLTLLGNALAQSGWTGPVPTPVTWRAMVRDRIAALDWTRVSADVAPFLERPQEAALLGRESLLQLLSG